MQTQKTQLTHTLQTSQQQFQTTASSLSTALAQLNTERQAHIASKQECTVLYHQVYDEKVGYLVTFHLWQCAFFC